VTGDGIFGLAVVVSSAGGGTLGGVDGDVEAAAADT